MRGASRLVPVLALLALVPSLAACGAEDGAAPTSEPPRLVAERLALLDDGGVAVVGIAAHGDPDESSGCVPGESAWDVFAARVDATGAVGAPSVITEEELQSCGDLVLTATTSAGTVSALAWVVFPAGGDSDGHGPVSLRWHADGGTSHDRESAAFLWDQGPVAWAETGLRGGGLARMSALRGGRRTGLELVLELPDGTVRVRSAAYPPDAVLYENWLYWYSLVAGRDAVYGSGPYTRGDDATYLFPLFKHRLDGKLDRSFGEDGVVLVRPPGTVHHVVTQVALDREGRVLAVGGADDGGRRVTFVLRYLPDGRPDPSFGEAGLVRLDLGPATESIYADARAALAVRDDGRIVVAGGVQARGSSLWLLDEDGRADPAFGRRGRVVLTPVR